MFQVPSTITKIVTMGDHSLRLQVDVERELNPEENTKVFELYNKTGWFVFKAEELMPEDIETPEFVKEFKSDKTPSQRLRGVLYKLWEKNGSTGLFDDFYKRKLEEIITHFKDKLE